MCCSGRSLEGTVEVSFGLISEMMKLKLESYIEKIA
jgi:hypothetical protein